MYDYSESKPFYITQVQTIDGLKQIQIHQA